MSFAALALSPALLNALSAHGLETPTPIQRDAIPPMLAGRDVLACAQTGSGKTVAYALPLLQQWLGSQRSSPRRLQGLVLVPTRELADQVGETLSGLAEGWMSAPKVAVVYGGVSINPQMMALRGGADIVVATPGRLLDLVEHNALHLHTTQTLVLDEADRLLDLGFAEELQRILALLPARRQNLLCSATFPPAVDEMAAHILHKPVRVEVPAEPESRPDITQHAIEVDADRRTMLLKHLIETRHAEDRVLVFAATKYATELVAHKLHRAGLHAAAFHGELSQGTRRATLAAFKASELQVVVATDVAARGIDIARLPVVVNYDLPRSPADHVHRIGRTGRAGESGIAYSFITPEMEGHFRLIEKRQGQRVPREQIEGFEPSPRAQAAAPGDAEVGEHVEAHAGEQKGVHVPGTGGIKGHRKSKKDKLREAAALQAEQTAAQTLRKNPGK
nr:DEAD/DEAH box helicase [Aquabacterium sp.]